MVLPAYFHTNCLTKFLNCIVVHNMHPIFLAA